MHFMAVIKSREFSGKCIYRSYKGWRLLNQVCERGTFAVKDGI